MDPSEIAELYKRHGLGTDGVIGSEAASSVMAKYQRFIPKPSPVPPVEAHYARWKQRGRQVPVFEATPDLWVRSNRAMQTLFEVFEVKAQIDLSGKGRWDARVRIDGTVRRLGIATSDWDNHWALEVPAGRPPVDIWICTHCDAGAKWRVDFVGWCDAGLIGEMKVPSLTTDGQGIEWGAAVPFDRLRPIDELLSLTDRGEVRVVSGGQK